MRLQPARFTLAALHASRSLTPCNDRRSARARTELYADRSLMNEIFSVLTRPPHAKHRPVFVLVIAYSASRAEDRDRCESRSSTRCLVIPRRNLSLLVFAMAKSNFYRIHFLSSILCIETLKFSFFCHIRTLIFYFYFYRTESNLSVPVNFNEISLRQKVR